MSVLTGRLQKNCALYWSRDDGELASLIDKADFMSADEITEMGVRARKTRS